MSILALENQKPVTQIKTGKAKKRVISDNWLVMDGLYYELYSDAIRFKTKGRGTNTLKKADLKNLFDMDSDNRKEYLTINYTRDHKTSIYLLIELVISGKLDLFGLSVNTTRNQVLQQKQKQETGKPKRKNEKCEYTQIEGTVFLYGYDGDILFFKKYKGSPIMINRDQYTKLMTIESDQVNSYIFNNFNRLSIWLVKKVVYFAKTGKVAFFDITPPKPVEWIEPPINKIIKAALKRERVRLEAVNRVS